MAWVFNPFTGTFDVPGPAGPAGPSSITVGTTTITSGTANRILYDNGTVVSESANLQFNGSAVGLGGAANTWNGENAIQGAYVALSGNNQVDITANAYYSTGWKYTAASIATTLYSQTSGAHKWFFAASGAKDAAITFLQAMTIDTSGYLGINGAPSTACDVYGVARVRRTSATGQYVDISVGAGGTSLNVSAASGAFRVSTNGGTTVMFNIDGSGNATFPSSGSFGYGTGAGLTVTQGTSRTTGVTINRPCGAITLVSAAGSATYSSFTVSNNVVAATDTIIVNQKSGTDKYIILVTSVGAGNFEITCATTGGTTTEQPVFNFAVIKAVTS